jgi:hypothetical protein
VVAAGGARRHRDRGRLASPRIGGGTLAMRGANAFILRGIGEMTLGGALRRAP